MPPPSELPNARIRLNGQLKAGRNSEATSVFTVKDITIPQPLLGGTSKGMRYNLGKWLLNFFRQMQPFRNSSEQETSGSVKGAKDNTSRQPKPSIAVTFTPEGNGVRGSTQIIASPSVMAVTDTGTNISMSTKPTNENVSVSNNSTPLP